MTHEELGRIGTSVRDALPSTSREQAARQRAAFVDEHRTATEVSGWSSFGRWGLAAAVVAALVWGVNALRKPQAPPSVASISAEPETSPPDSVAATQTDEPGQADDSEAMPPAVADHHEAPDEAVVLESGHIDVDVGRARKIVAGPYVVTSGPDDGFELTWDAETDRLTLEVDAGRVSVARASSYHVVVAGQTAHSTAREFVVVETAEEKTRMPTKELEEAKDATPPWVRAAKRGEYRSALALASAGGVLDSLGSLKRHQLKLLADVTRLGGEVDRSRSVLLELRRRFPKSTDARRAAFYLGRLSEGAGEHEDAVEWYREYLRSSEQGSFAAQARGRLLKVLSRGSERGETLAAARDYLERHPKGAYAELASRLIGASSPGATP